mgnify:CR=1 FL=1
MERSGDPQLIGVPVFTVGSIALGFHLVEYYASGNFGGPIPIILGCTGLFLFLAAFWALAIGASWVAGFFALYGGFWISYSLLVLGLNNGWYTADVPFGEGDAFGGNLQHTVAAFAISWAAILFFLAPSSFRLPLIYGAINALVVVALCLVATAFLITPDDGGLWAENVLNVAGIVVWVFAGLGAWVFMCVADISLGGKGLPLGPVLRKPAE